MRGIRHHIGRYVLITLSVLGASVFGAGVLGSSAEAADRIEPTPKELETVDVSERLAQPLPLDAVFTTSAGAEIRLADLITDKPVILTFNYSNCPLLCSTQLGGLVDGMRKMPWSIGEDFEVITISLDPNETSERAQETKEQYLDRYERKGASEGWHFLTGTEANIKAVADAVGFGYFYYAERKDYLHPAVLTLVSPRGNVSGYIYGVSYEPDALRDSLIVAKVGEVSESLTKFILACYHYDAPTGNGVIVAKIMRYGGLIFAFGFAIVLVVFGLKRSHGDAHVHQVGSPEDHV